MEPGAGWGGPCFQQMLSLGGGLQGMTVLASLRPRFLDVGCRVVRSWEALQLQLSLGLNSSCAS